MIVPCSRMTEITSPGTAVASSRGHRVAALSGFLAAAAALGTGELLSGLSRKIPSLVLGVAGVFVDETPGGIVRWSIDTFGAKQKTLLVTGVVVASLLLGALFGILSRRSRAVGAVGFAAFGVIGGWAAAREAQSSDFLSWLSALVSVGVGVAALTVLLAKSVPERVKPEPYAADPNHPTPMSRLSLNRRGFLVASSATAAWAVIGTGLGRRLRQSANVAAAREELAPRLATGPVIVPAGVETFDKSVRGISPIITSNRDFYRTDASLLVPQVDPDDWSLRITGMVDREIEFSFEELLAMERIEEFITLACVSNEVGGDLVGNARWSGVPLPALLDLAGVAAGASQIVGRSVDGWTAGFPTELALDGRPSMVALTMNGVPLPVKHGFPARLLVPGLYGYVSATKWLTEIELTTWEAFDGYWIPRGWAKEGPIRVQSRIDVPRRFETIKAGRTAVAGVAWGPARSISRVEVQIDDGPWVAARLSGELSENAWFQWVYEWDAAPGSHFITVRATDGTGETQTAKRSQPAPSGATGYHSINVDVK